jgi:hypothetical protein
MDDIADTNHTVIAKKAIRAVKMIRIIALMDRALRTRMIQNPILEVEAEGSARAIVARAAESGGNTGITLNTSTKLLIPSSNKIWYT